MIEKYRRKGVIVDTNLFLLYVAGAIDRDLIEKEKGIKDLKQSDYDLLEELLAPVGGKIILTPHIATEVDNLTKRFSPYLQGRFRDALKAVFSELPESTYESRKAAKIDGFRRLGLADSALAVLGRKKLLITDDFALANHVQDRGHDAINFTNLKLYY